MKTVSIIVLLLCCLVATLRFVLPARGLNHDDIFKDLAHLFVGSLFGGAVVAWLIYATICGLISDTDIQFMPQWAAAVDGVLLFAAELTALAVALTVVEVIAFFVTSGTS